MCAVGSVGCLISPFGPAPHRGPPQDRGRDPQAAAEKLGVTHWSSRLLAKHLKIGDATVARAWGEYGVAPWWCETFKFSTDPELVTKVTDVVGLYLAPPQNAVVLCLDEKS